MRKWEMNYNKLKNGELDIAIKKLEPKMDKKSMTKEEYKEYNRLLKVKENMPKIANIIEYRERLTKQIAVLDKEIEAVERLEFFETNSEKIDRMFKRTNAQLNKLVSEKATIEKQLKNKNLSQEEKDELLAKKRNITEEIDANNEKYAKMQRVLGQKDRIEKNHGKYSKEQLEARKNTFLQRVSKCNMVGNKLVKGLSWDSIEMDLENWQDTRLISKEPITKKIERTTEERENFEIVSNETRESSKVTNTESKEIKVTENLPTKVSRFTKIKNAIKNWVKNTFRPGYEKDEEHEQYEEDKEENTPKASVTDKKESLERSKFTKYLKEVAEKGYKEVEKERVMKEREKEIQNKKEAREKAIQKHKELKKEAYERETEKYGKEYAERSMKSEEDQR